MNSPWVDGLDDLVSHVRSGDRIGPSGFHFSRAPMAQLRALVDAGFTGLTYVAWGGGVPLELLLSAGAVDRIVFCFSSLDIFGLAPRFRRALEEGAVEVDERTALGFMNGLRAAGERVPFAVMQDPVACDLREGFAMPLPDAGTSGGQGAPVVGTAAIDLDAFLLHADRADDAGNVEIRGARGLDLPAIFAARKVLVTVEERVPVGELGTPHGYVLPREFVTAVTASPGGAWPTSSLPRYPTDYRALQRIAGLSPDQPLGTDLVTPTAERLDELSAMAAIPPERIRTALRERSPAQTDGRAPFTVDELMVSVIARTVANDSVCSVGSVSPLATIAYLLAKRLWAPEATIMSSNGGYLDVASRPMSTITAELLDFHSAVSHIGSDDSYHWYYQQGRISHEVVSAAQIDPTGATNTAWVVSPSGRRIRLPGQGGMGDVADMHQRFFLYLARHSTRTLVERVDFVSAKRAFHGTERRGIGYREGPMNVLTNLGMFTYDTDAGALLLTSLHPGVTYEQVAEATGFEVRPAPNVTETPAPSDEELRMIRDELDPLGVRRLEFVGSGDRGTLIDELLSAEEHALEALRSTP